MGRRRSTRACGLHVVINYASWIRRSSRDDLQLKVTVLRTSLLCMSRPEEEEVVSAVNRKQQLQPVKPTGASGAPDNSSLSHFSARNRHRHAIEQIS